MYTRLVNIDSDNGALLEIDDQFRRIQKIARTPAH